jgi:hypothetical protein
MTDADNRWMDPQARIERFSLAAHRLAMSRLRERPERVEELLATISRWRTHRGVTHSDPYMTEWEALLRKPLDEIERVVCGEGEHETVLRSVSPMGRLITTEERDRLLMESKRS